jgi:hydrogenase small subunit
MKVTRRDFLKYCLGSAAVLGLNSSVIGRLEETLAAGGGPPVIWLAGANCTGCTVSLANRISTSHPTDVADLLVNTIDLAYHPNLMGAAGDLAVSALRDASSGPFVLVVEGGIPTAFGGHTAMLWTEAGVEVTAQSAVMDLAPRAAAVVCVGTCSSFGGIPAAAPNPTGIKSVSSLTGVNTFNIPGCPAHPDWIIGTVAQLLAGSPPALDSLRRPTAYYGSIVHNNCPRNGRDWASTFGVQDLCLRAMGCKGPNTHGNCQGSAGKGIWNNATNWCVGANSICLGCTESGFPDAFSPIYSGVGALPRGHQPSNPDAGSCFRCHDASGNADD